MWLCFANENTESRLPRACVCACICVCVASENQALAHTYVHTVKPAFSLWLLQNDC